MTIDRRRVIRSLTVQVLYELDHTTHDVQAVLATYANFDATDNDARSESFLSICAYYDETTTSLSAADFQMLHRLVNGVVVHREILDSLVAEHAPEWPPDQIAPIDRNVLRQAIYELVYLKLPTKIVINEAVEIAKLFGTDSSSRFVNGVLGAIANHLEKLWEDYQPLV